MKKIVLYSCLFLLFSAFITNSERKVPKVRSNTSFQRGEVLKYRLHYGFVNAGVATLEVFDDLARVNRKDCYKIEVRGESTGAFGLMMKVEDTWRSFIDTNTITPERFQRDISEAKYRLKETMYIHKDNEKIEVHQKKPNKDTKVKYYDAPSGVHDIVSGCYYLRNIDYDQLDEGDIIALKAFFEDELYDFEIRYKGKETVKTKLGKVKAIKLVPIMPKNSLFEGEDSIKMWLSDDKNHIPLAVEAEMFVGSVKLDIEEYDNLRHSLNLED